MPNAQGLGFKTDRLSLSFIYPALFLLFAYGLLALTFVQDPANLMQRCVLMNLNMARIWSVAHIELGVAYIGVFLGMTYYLVKAGRLDHTHFRDLLYAFAYLIASFILDFICVRCFAPFIALLIGDAVVMTFTFLVSKKIWFQRLLGIFVPLVFFTCAMGHIMEGLSFWQLTFPANVPWTMVTADIGFAILVNAVRFPAFIRGHDLENEIETVKEEARERQRFLTDVLSSVTDGKLQLVVDDKDLPLPLALVSERLALRSESLSFVRKASLKVWTDLEFPVDRESDMLIGVGEAIMNAVVHGSDGSAELRADGNRLQVWIEDTGSGIQLDRLPRATLEKGYSTVGSLGHGFSIILATVDHLDISTGPMGTKLVLTFDRVQSPREFSIMR